MTAHDMPRFCEWFDLLAVTHRLMATEDLRQKMKAEYFDILRDYPVEVIEYAYGTLRRRMKKWPVPADWMEALPPMAEGWRLPLATDAEMAEITAAERQGYDSGGGCTCPTCTAAGCTHLPSRYVPRLNQDGEVIQRRWPERSRPVILGRWIHGDELRCWYAARAKCYEAVALIKSADDAARLRRLSTEDRMLRLVKRAEVATNGAA
jgi:hypothetical protein